MNKVRIRLFEDDHYAIKYLYRKSIDIYNIEYNKDGNIYTIADRDLEKLNLDEVDIVSYRGLKSLLLKLKQNTHFLLATIMSILIMYFLSNVIVDIDVIHSNKDIRVLIEDELYDLGIRPFTFKKTFATLQEIKEKIREDYPENIEWLEIVDDGMKYTVKVEERIITKEEVIPEYCDIVSNKDAVVLSAISSKGMTVVSPNDLVKKGSTLISGEIKFNDQVKSHVCAEGEVYGNTWYQVATSIPFEHTTKEYTGEKKNNIGIEFGSTYTRIFKIHFDEYDVEKVKIFGLGRFAIYKEIVKEFNSKEETYTEEEALEEALKEGREKLKLKLDEDATILSEKVLQSNSYNSIISVEIFYSVKEKIGTRVEKQIEIDEELE